jgi:hypothetical protein
MNKLKAYPFRCLNPECMAPLPYVFFNPNGMMRRFKEGDLSCVYCESKDIGIRDFEPLSDFEFKEMFYG